MGIQRIVVDGVERHTFNRGHNGIQCDAEGCSATINLDRTYDPRRARAEAAESGWAYRDGLDLCPEHARKAP
jgi:hypothetical protein